MIRRGLLLMALLVILPLAVAQSPAKKTPREALQAFGDLVGEWKCTGTPAGSREEVQRNFWTERMTWGWQFKGDDAWLKVDFEKGKHFTSGELRYIPDKDHFVLTLTTLKKEKLTFAGEMKDKMLTLERASEESQRLVFRFLHSNRFLYAYEVKPEGRPLYAKKWSVGATKEGEPFALGSSRPECIVSGGLGTSPVTYLGKTYYVCCSGCRDEFNANPAKYVKEYEAKKKK